MAAIAVVLGLVLVLTVLMDMVNTLITTQTSNGRWWLSTRVTDLNWRLVRWVAVRLPEGDVRSRILGGFAPVLVLQLLVFWVAQQVIGFGLIWWGVSGVSGVEIGSYAVAMTLSWSSSSTRHSHPEGSGARRFRHPKSRDWHFHLDRPRRTARSRA